MLISFNCRTELQLWTTIQNIKKGQIKNPYHKGVYNIGYYGVGKYKARINNKKNRGIHKVFNRCYNEKYHEKQSSYIDCKVSKEFWNFQNFAKWYNKKKYTCIYSLELDKDLLYEGNKIYSPSKCCLIPKEINNAINYKRNDINFMKKLYVKYKDELPYYLRMELYKLTIDKEGVT